MLSKLRVSDKRGPGVGGEFAHVDSCPRDDPRKEPQGEASLPSGAPTAFAQKSHLIL